MNNQNYYFCLAETANYDSVEAYVSDMALSSIWGDAPESEIPQARIEELTAIYEATHRGIKDIAGLVGISVRQLAFRFGIPQRSAENWATGCSECPTYVMLMLQECLGLFSVKREP